MRRLSRGVYAVAGAIAGVVIGFASGAAASSTSPSAQAVDDARQIAALASDIQSQLATPTAAPSSAAPSAAPSSAAPTPSTSSATTSCLPVPSVCGFPDATNTGAHGTLAPSGSIRSTTDGELIENLDVTGYIKVTSANVTIENVKVTGGDALGAIDLHQATGHTTITDVTVISTSSQAAGMTIHDATVTRANIAGGQDGIDAWGGGGANPFNIVQDSYIHDLTRSSTSHDDTLQTSGGDETFRHNTLLPFNGSDPMNSCLQIGALQGNLAQLTFAGNLCDGGNYSLNANSSGVPSTYSAGPIDVEGNTFGPDSRYGVHAHLGSPFSTTWVGNVADGSGAPVS